MTTALLDGLAHHCHIVETGNESYRFRRSSAEAPQSRIRERSKRFTPAAEDNHWVLEPGRGVLERGRGAAYGDKVLNAPP